MAASAAKLVARLERVIGCDCDEACSYTSQRTVRIRDRRLGLLHCFFLLAIFAYIIIAVVLVQQQYLRFGSLTGSVRVDVTDPLAAFRYPATLGSPPYCLGTSRATNNDTRYSFVPPNYYQWLGAGGPGPLTQQQGCSYLDSNFLASNDGADTGAVFLPSRITIHNQSLNLGPTCAAATLPSASCGFNDSSDTTWFVPDNDMFNLAISHSFTTSTGMSRTSVDMAGILLTASGDVVDPCEAYTSYGAGAQCPPGIGIGKQQSDVLPTRSLLLAAGISTLDTALAGSGRLSNMTRRFGGIVILVEIQYYNTARRTSSTMRGTGSFDSALVEYAYIVSTPAELQAFNNYTVTSNNVVPAATRLIYERAGIRILFRQTGAVGQFDFQTLLINLTVALGLLRVATGLVDIAATNCLPLRAIYRQYKERTTVDLSDVVDADDRATLARFTKELDLVDPVPPVLAELLAAKAQRVAERAALLRAKAEAAASRTAASTAVAVDADGVALTRRPTLAGVTTVVGSRGAAVPVAAVYGLPTPPPSGSGRIVANPLAAAASGGDGDGNGASSAAAAVSPGSGSGVTVYGGKRQSLSAAQVQAQLASAASYAAAAMTPGAAVVTGVSRDDGAGSTAPPPKSPPPPHATRVQPSAGAGGGPSVVVTAPHARRGTSASVASVVGAAGAPGLSGGGAGSATGSGTQPSVVVRARGVV